MSPSIITSSAAAAAAMDGDNDEDGGRRSGETQYEKGIKHMCDSGFITNTVPDRYIFPAPDRPGSLVNDHRHTQLITPNLDLPVIDFAHLQGPSRSHALSALSQACRDFGFFQLTNHGIPREVTGKMIEASRRFFELPYEERSKYMSGDMHAAVRYGTSFNQNKDRVFCWRDFLKLSCHPTLPEVLPFWPSQFSDEGGGAVQYATEAKSLYLALTGAVLETLGLLDDDTALKDFEDGSQLVVVNCYPSCPEPDLTLGMPPHSDYGFLTLLLQDEVEGLQIHHQGKWLTVQPIPGSFVVNVGDHLEIFSNGRYKSVLHRVLVNPRKSRISVASLHSFPIDKTVRPSEKLVDEANPRRYKDTTFASFLDYISSCEPKSKNFLDSRKLP